MPGRNFGPPKRKSDSAQKRWENKERGPRGPIKERFSGRMGGLYDVDEGDAAAAADADFDDIASKADDDQD